MCVYVEFCGGWIRGAGGGGAAAAGGAAAGAAAGGDGARGTD